MKVKVAEDKESTIDNRGVSLITFYVMKEHNLFPIICKSDVIEWIVFSESVCNTP